MHNRRYWAGANVGRQDQSLVADIVPTDGVGETELRPFEEHQKGHIVVDGIELTNDVKNVEAIRREVGMVFQHFNLFPHLTILENLTLAPIWVRGIPKKEAEDTAMFYLNRVRIPEQAKKYPGQLSGGQQQRVAIARALCMKPKIMPFDEPPSTVDPEMAEEALAALIRGPVRGRLPRR